MAHPADISDHALRRRAVLAGLGLLTLSPPGMVGRVAHAQPTPEPLPAATGPIILNITGAIALPQAEFDLAGLEGLGVTRLTTRNPFLTGVQEFDGVLLSRVLERVGASGTRLVARALDGYQADIPVADARRFPVLIATRRNGAPMRVRDKGPLWIIYPIDQHPETAQERFSTRSVWQLRHLQVV
ncbi:MAG: molybdopterin-dependent oxidoreductase [Alphaproteobacteria bacterium]|nr:molybdopterin-dependent oxidoreductase [Alphaproteobacteria bacterium]